MSRKKIVLLGDTQTGKTKFVSYCYSGKKGLIENHKYMATKGVHTHIISKLNIVIWDRGTKNGNIGLGEGYNILADAFIIFGENTKKWEKEAQESKNIKVFFARDKSYEQIESEIINYYNIKK